MRAAATPPSNRDNVAKREACAPTSSRLNRRTAHLAPDLGAAIRESRSGFSGARARCGTFNPSW